MLRLDHATAMKCLLWRYVLKECCHSVSPVLARMLMSRSSQRNHRTGHGVADIMNNEGACTRPDVLVHEVANSGHQLYIDQPVEFNQVILTGCRSRAPLEPLTTTSLSPP